MTRTAFRRTVLMLIIILLLAFVGILVSQILPKKGSSNTTEPIPVVEVKSDAEIAKAYFPEDYIGYRYPVLPTMSTWPYGNHADMISVCQIPENVLKEMSTEELLESVLYYPLFPDAYLYDSRQKAYEIFKNSMGAFAAMAERGASETACSSTRGFHTARIPADFQFAVHRPEHPQDTRPFRAICLFQRRHLSDGVHEARGLLPRRTSLRRGDHKPDLP